MEPGLKLSCRLSFLRDVPLIYHQAMVLLAREGLDVRSVAERLAPGQPSPAQLRWLRRGLDQPGFKLPLFDEWGQRVNEQTIRSCIAQGWAEPWFANPLKPEWLVCKLTDAGRAVANRR